MTWTRCSMGGLQERREREKKENVDLVNISASVPGKTSWPGIVRLAKRPGLEAYG